MPVNFNEIKLGYASAEVEGATEPDLLLDGYYNQAGIVGEARNGSKFLFLGYKGSGKSAINEHLRLTSNKDSQLFVTSTFLADFPYKDFKNIINGDVDTKYPTAWSWLLLLHLFDSFTKDEGSASNREQDFLASTETLKKLGLLPSPNLRQVVLVSSKRSFKIALPTIVETVFERTGQEQGLQLPFFVDRLKATAQNFVSESRHILVIDGLDDILTSSQIQYDALAALVLEVSRLNLMFQRASSPAKIVLLCRTDLYERLPGANKNKIRQDCAVNLEWYHDPRKPLESNLIKLANLRARLTDTTVTDIFSQYFPKHVEEKRVETFLLDLTRHTPRDFIQLLKHIQKFSVHSVLTRDQILSGVRSYSIHYFLPEIKDELVGYVTADDVDKVIDAMGSLRKRDFDFAELEAKLKEKNQSLQLDVSQIISAMFECSAIGNVHNRRGGTTYYTFKYRNQSSTLNLSDRLILHRGMWKALNLV